MFFDNFDRYCKQLGKTNSEVTKAIGLDPSSCTGWRNGSVPRNSTLKKLADYFGITVEELMGKKKEPAGMGGLEWEWELGDIEAVYKNATPATREAAKAAAKAAALAVLESEKIKEE